MEVGVRELRDGLSKHLAEVKAGATVTITDHGRPIAKIIPMDRPTKLEQLRLEGKVQPAEKPKRRAPKRVVTKGTVSDLVSEQRG